MTFYLFREPDEALRMKSYTSSSRGTKMTIRIEVETSDPFSYGYALGQLAEVHKGQRTKPAKPKAPLLALPAPQLALPKPMGV